MADDFDFTPEGIDVNKLDDKEKALYEKLNGQFKGAYTKKTQALAEERKQWEQEKAQLAADAKRYQEEVQGFNNWWNSLTPQQQQYYNQLTPGQQQNVLDERGLTHPEDSAADYRAIQKDLSDLKAWGTQIHTGYQKMEQKVGTLEELVKMGMNWADFRVSHPDADRKRLFERMQKDGIKDFGLAYELEYKDDLIAKQVDEKVNQRVTEEKAKFDSEKKLPEFTPASRSALPTGDNVSKSWGESTNKFMEGFSSALRSEKTGA